MAWFPFSLASADGTANGNLICDILPAPPLGPDDGPDPRPLPRIVLSPSPSSMIPRPCCFLHLRKNIKTKATMAIPATLPTTPPTTAFLASGVSPGLGSDPVSSAVGCGAGMPLTPPASSPNPLITTVGADEVVVEVSRVRELVLLLVKEEDEVVERKKDVEVLVEFEKRAGSVLFVKIVGGRRVDEELKFPEDNMGNGGVMPEGVDVSVSTDVDWKEDENSGSVTAGGVGVGVPSWLGSSVGSGRDTLGNRSSGVVRPAVTAAGRVSMGDGATGSERRVERLTSAPVASTYWTTETVWTTTTWRGCSFASEGERAWWFGCGCWGFSSD